MPLIQLRMIIADRFIFWAWRLYFDAEKESYKIHQPAHEIRPVRMHLGVILRDFVDLHRGDFSS